VPLTDPFPQVVKTSLRSISCVMKMFFKKRPWLIHIFLIYLQIKYIMTAAISCTSLALFPPTSQPTASKALLWSQSRSQPSLIQAAFSFPGCCPFLAPSHFAFLFSPHPLPPASSATSPPLRALENEGVHRRWLFSRPWGCSSRQRTGSW